MLFCKYLIYHWEYTLWYANDYKSADSHPLVLRNTYLSWWNFKFWNTNHLTEKLNCSKANRVLHGFLVPSLMSPNFLFLVYISHAPHWFLIQILHWFLIQILHWFLIQILYIFLVQIFLSQWGQQMGAEL
jgi:hypothetical protein